ncbi:6991_t:CDS:10, partial [Funneliformis geosporum]
LKDRIKNAGMEWLVIEELKELLRLWKTDLELTRELKNKDLDGCYATRTVNIINKVDRLRELLDALHEQLIECNTAEECFIRFPEVQNILEDLVCIRILTLHDTLCQKILECLLEYTKLFDKMDNVFTHFMGLPKYWCLKVLRTISIGHSQGDNVTEKLAYLCGAGSSDLDNSYIEEAISIITNFLDNVENYLFQLPSTCIENISEQIIPLLKVPDMFGLIERVILFATKDKLYHTINTEYENVLSERFVEYLVSFHHVIYMKLCNQAKLGLWTNCPAAVEYETLATFQQLLFPVNKDYMTPRSITEFLQNKPFFYHVIKYPKIFGLCFDVFIKCLEVSPDWRVLRLIKYTIAYIIESKDRNGFISLDITYYFPKLLESLVQVLANDTPGTHAFYKMNSLRRNLLLEQSTSVIHNYRKCVWITLMSFTKWHYWIIEAFFDVQRFPKIHDLQEPINYLAWLIYPREDNNIMIFSNAIGDLITSIRECLKLKQNGKEKVLKCLGQYQHILKSNLVIVDITLGLWSKTKSLEFMEEILNACIMSNDQFSPRQVRTMQTNENINLSALTKILDYFYENQDDKNEEIMNYLNRLKERCIM